MSDSCTECGAVLPPSGDCWTRVHELLEIENRVLPRIDAETAKRAHYFAIASYQLQHPSRVTAPALAGLRSGVRRMLAPDAPPIDRFRRHVGRTVGTGAVGRTAASDDHRHVDAAWPTTWSHTVCDVLSRPDDDYPHATTDWATATIDDLDTALGAPD